MALCQIHFNNLASIERMGSATVILPEGKAGPFPTLYLLHGLSDDDTVWVRRTNIERHVADLPLIVVMPDVERGFYTDSPTNPKAAFESMITRDLIGWVDNTFHTVRSRDGRVAAGFSMGGYGAVKLAFKRPDLFSAAVGFAGAYQSATGNLFDNDEWRRESVNTFGNNPVGGPDDVFALARNADRALLPAVRLVCGVDDFLIRHNRTFHDHLENLAIPHEYVECPGGHNWQFCEEQIPSALEFLTRSLSTGRAAGAVGPS